MYLFARDKGTQVIRHFLSNLRPSYGAQIVFAAMALSSGDTLAGEAATTAQVFVMGSPPPNAVIGDSQRCRTDLAPANSLADRVEYQLPTERPFSIAVAEERRGQLCGGSFYVFPESGVGYAVRLTLDKQFCAAQLFRLDPRAEVHALLIRTDNHPQLDELICATQRGTPGSSRLSVGGRFTGVSVSGVKAEIGDDGFCGKFAQINAEEASGVELASGMKRWFRLQFRSKQVTTALNQTIAACDLSFAFTPSAGTSYFIDYAANLGHCEAKLLRAERTGTILPAPIESMPKGLCSASH